MKHFRILFPILILALLLSGCGSTSREPYEYTYSGSSGPITLIVNPEAQTILDGTDVYYYTRTENPNGTVYYVITYPNGGRFTWTETQNGGYGDANGVNENLYLSGNTLVWALEAGEPAGKAGNVFGGIVLIVLGAVNFFLPELPFYLRYGWAVRDAEPSDAYITWTKIGGVLAAVLGLVWCFV